MARPLRIEFPGAIYNQFVSAGLEEPSPWEQLMAQCILGGRDLIQKVGPALKESSSLTEIPKRQRMTFRPPLEELLGSVREISKTDRDRPIQPAHLEHGYTLTEIAKYLWLHYTTISKIINQKTS